MHNCALCHLPHVDGQVYLWWLLMFDYILFYVGNLLGLPLS